MVTDTWFKF